MGVIERFVAGDYPYPGLDSRSQVRYVEYRVLDQSMPERVRQELLDALLIVREEGETKKKRP